MELIPGFLDLNETETIFKEFLEIQRKDHFVNALKGLRNRLDDEKQEKIIWKRLEEKKNDKEKCEELKNSVREKLEHELEVIKNLNKEIENLKSQEREALKEKKGKEEEIEKVRKAYRLVKHTYKERLGCHIHLEDDVIIFRFTKFSGADDKRYLVKLKNANGKMICLNIIPKLKSRDALFNLLNETNVQTFLSSIWKKFKKVAQST